MKKVIYTILVLIIVHSTLNIENCMCQWVQTNGPGPPNLYCLANSGTNIFCGTSLGGVYLTTNNGTSWTAVNNGLPGPDFTTSALAVSGANLFAGLGSGVFLSTNNGSNWTAAGLTGKYISSLAVSGSNLFAGTGNEGVFLSTNNGASWTTVNNGLTNLNIKALAISGTNIFAGTYNGGVFLSTNNGSSWTSVGLITQSVVSFAVSGTNIFAGTAIAGVYKSTNNGTNWIAVNNGLNNQNVLALALSDTKLFAGTEVGVYYSSNNGTSWSQKNEGFGVIPRIYSLLIANNYIFVGTNNSSVWRRPLSDFIGIKNISSEIPSVYSLSQNYPNPFNPTTNIKFQVKSSGFVKLVVFDILGKEVANLVNEKLSSGTYEAAFDGSNMASGIYLYRLTTGNFVDTKRMILIK